MIYTNDQIVEKMDKKFEFGHLQIENLRFKIHQNMTKKLRPKSKKNEPHLPAKHLPSDMKVVRNCPCRTIVNRL